MSHLGAAIRSDDDLIGRVQQGERRDFVPLFERYYARIENYARWMLRDADHACDVASLTFLHAFRSVHTYRTGAGASYLPYLLTICRRLASAEKIRERDRAEQPLDEAMADQDGRLQTLDLPLTAVLRRETADVIQSALMDLPNDDREIILLAFESELSRRDIADVMGKPSVTAVTSHLHRAMQKLRRIVAQQGYFATPTNLGVETADVRA